MHALNQPGQFIDQPSLPLDYNRYRYTHNDPVNRVDPSGLDDAISNIGANVVKPYLYSAGETYVLYMGRFLYPIIYIQSDLDNLQTFYDRATKDPIGIGEKIGFDYADSVSRPFTAPYRETIRIYGAIQDSDSDMAQLARDMSERDARDLVMSSGAACSFFRAARPLPIQTEPSQIAKLKVTVRFLRDQGVDDIAVRRKIVQSGFEGVIGADTPASLEQFRRLFPQTIKAGKSFRGRLGDIDTRVATINESIQMERSGLEPIFEWKVDAASGVAYVDIVGFNAAGQPVRVVQLIRAIPRTGGLIVFDKREMIKAGIISDALGQQYPEFIITGKKSR